MLPLSQPILGLDGTPIRGITVPKGTPIAVGIFSSNRNKVLWGEDAGEWKPERWLVQPGTEVMSDGLNKGDKERQAHGVAKQQLPGVYSGM